MLYKKCKANLERTPSEVAEYDFCDDEDIFQPDFDFEIKELSKSFSMVRETSNYEELETEERHKKTKAPRSSRVEKKDKAFELEVGMPSIELVKAQSDHINARTIDPRSKNPIIHNMFHSPSEETKGDTDEEKEQKEDQNYLFFPRPIHKLGTRLIDQMPRMSYEDFNYVKYLGRGAFGRVDLVKCKLNNLPYALKQMSKVEIARQNRVQHLLREKDLMNQCSHPNIVRLEGTFKDDENCYFVLEYHPVGELAGLILKRKKLNKSLTRFYAKEIISVLEYFQKHNIVHRDMKPENILIDANFHCKVSDFGAAKIIDPAKVEEELKNLNFNFEETSSEIEQDPSFELDSMEGRFSGFNGTPEIRERGGTFVGTPLYVSPEMLAHNLACFGSDLWGLGCIIFQCLTGEPPFKGATEAHVFEKILECRVDFPPDMDPVAMDLILKLMEKHPNDRLGAGKKGSHNSMKELKAHAFFKGKKFKHLHKKKPPVLPKLVKKVNEDFQKKAESDSSDDDLAEFDQEIAPEVTLPAKLIKTFSGSEENSCRMMQMGRQKSKDYKPKGTSTYQL